MQNKSILVGIIVVILPTMFTIVAYSESFSLSWNQGRGGFLFAMAFVVAELVGIKYVIPKNRFYLCVPLIVLTIAYFAFLPFGLHDYIMSLVDVFGVLEYSWGWLFDFAVMALFVTATLAILFGRKWFRIAPAGPIFLAGNAIILALDSFFPYDTLGPLQYIVPYLVQTNVWVITVLDLGVATARDNLMFLNGDFGPFALQVFWPSAGVHSVIIYSLVMMAFLIKMNIIRRRKIMYFIIGIAGTIFVNMIRIFSLSVYALKVTTDPEAWEEFHSVAGEIMFLPWLFIFLLIVTAIETKRLKKIESTQDSQK
ncbi:MAG: thaumarchaeosortase [Thaumarchaeota archaeon]|jgi:thaumarchaeosortase|nr:thaumarchaeosortase [Nitrososphaerota archaeon]|tara:strand:+ start:3577 stop:4509 length:933 start_codon:yes stop_codon:yes gene_type:complete